MWLGFAGLTAKLGSCLRCKCKGLDQGAGDLVPLVNFFPYKHEDPPSAREAAMEGLVRSRVIERPCLKSKWKRSRKTL